MLGRLRSKALYLMSCARRHRAQGEDDRPTPSPLASDLGLGAGRTMSQEELGFFESRMQADFSPYGCTMMSTPHVRPTA